ncbi:MAG TPA: RNB domain-containing ribonuclease [Verrucomicrobiae bacterium]|nr:RNB domain-containing ribonuclease [Verrucomicrobiae bacterium]
MPRPEPHTDKPRPPVTEAEVIAQLSRSRKPQSLRELAAALNLRHSGRRALVKLARQMKKRGDIHEYPNGRVGLPKEKQGAQQTPPAPQKAAPLRHGSDPRGEARPAVRPEANQLTGRLVAHRDGYGFVVPDTPRKDLDGDLFIGREALGDAMHGDHVLASIERRKRFGAGAGASRAEGRILRVLGRAHTTVVGLFRYGARGNTVAPYESRLTQEIIIPPGEELTPELQGKLGLHQPKKGLRVHELDGAVVNVELTRFPRSGVPPAGRVIEIIGRPGDFGVDVEILIRKNHLPHVFPDEVLAEAAAAARPVGDSELAPSVSTQEVRRDFRHLPIVTIDGETARDFDDAVYVERLGNGHWQLQVHIADVSHYVRRGAALDREARLRGTSVYFPNRAVPMLPEELSNGICSLNPREDRLVMSALMEIDASGEIVASQFARGVIRSAERMTYTAVNAVLQNDPAATAQYESLAGHFRDMRDLALILNARRRRLGSIDFDLPEPVFEFDPQGQMTGIVRSERNIAHRLIEEFMLAANQAVARYLESRGIASLHRVHEKPDPKKILEFEALAQTFGYSLGVENLAERRIEVKHGASRPQRFDRGARHGRRGGGREKPMTVSLPGTMDIAIRPSHYQRLAEKIAGKPEERIISYLMLRSLKQARYAVDPLGHFALAFDQYTHFTSPIRRYPDLIVHRVLKWALDHPHAKPAPEGSGVAGESSSKEKEQAVFGPYRRGELEAIAEESSETERRAESAERELMAWKTADFMEDRLGEEYDALITSVQKFGFFVELMEIFVEGLVPLDRIEELTGEHVFYREQDHAIVSGSGQRSSAREPKHAADASAKKKSGRGGAAGAHIWKLGDRIRVRAERIDPIRRRVEFSPVD